MWIRKKTWPKTDFCGTYIWKNFDKIKGCHILTLSLLLAKLYIALDLKWKFSQDSTLEQLISLKIQLKEFSFTVTLVINICLMYIINQNIITQATNVRVYSKHFFRSVTRQKYSILNWVLKNSIFKNNFFFVQINQDFIVYTLKRKLAVFHCLFTFSLFNIHEKWSK